MFKIGHGYDVHRFDEHSNAAPIKLGGIDVPSEKQLLAHSDGDVVLHALCDALLGAIAAGDIGEHFPDTDAQYAGADSRVLLRHVVDLVQEQGYRVGNVDITIAAQAPRLKDYKQAMANTIAADLRVEASCVNVKATTTEKLGFVGRKEGIAVDAVCLLMKAEP
ncbi:2-C-methyl-D-erythritol 2,4-cyclodiphosphate synthase [Reinekea marina]|uniref:2-C-methyl-D-erythritol 2,4-cyclodiphosphate synthase n=1 Tax=Reinekea marina TaxID=1310421 RepID=A0ABV7WQ60_9GAMM|nr:2-C-methyl-D-erythritol 2,4-cyclodiphosphate synthase [Reinekea marina]MDN3650334.1 2-C-methyl-D-erythritol 2,4-cyclodiphosphate synthase [Reinekea marina]MDN3651163.1 2-C-methyl-D-erythritol 2,4-cyclodiphosphate synthase [Reinekea marina]